MKPIKLLKMLITAAVLLSSCKKDETLSLYLEVASLDCVLAPTNTSYFMAVNAVGKWTVESDAEWCTLYPQIGEDEGRFYINAEDRNKGYARNCQVKITLQDGSKRTINVKQNGLPAYLKLDEERLTFSSETTSGVVLVSANVNWIAEVFPQAEGEDVSWLTLGETTEKTQAFRLGDNTGVERRAGIIRFFHEDDPNIYTELTIIQFPVLDKNKAILKTIREVFVENSGIIEDNIKIEGFVTSDKTSGNTEAYQMYLQDNSGRGILFEFSDAEKNVYALNDKVGVWLAACEMKTVDGVTKITNLTEANLIGETSLTGTEATPVTVTDLSTIDPAELENTLVKLTNVCFTYPFGTLYNSNKETGNDCVTLLRDSYGNNINLRTHTTFTEKHARLVPAGNCNVTGILMKHGDGLVLRIRRAVDLSDSTIPSVYRTIVEWYNVGKWINTTLGSSWIPKTGAGDMTFGAFGALKQGWNYDRIDPFQKNSATNGHHGPQLDHWWDTGSGTGQSWEFSTSTADATGDIYLSLYTGSSNDGPKNFTVEWTDSSETGAKWTQVGTYECWSWGDANSDHSNILMNVDMKLPGVQGKTLLRIRLRCSSAERAQENKSNPLISINGSNKLCYISIEERK
ncbi:MAG: BACON domain-containing protein [Alistipes sp.]|uniref:DUF5689 domain-containing protein n=1 Tax=Alistipes intestinihominis TaxID=3133172 RepID=A0ABV1GVV2_9BACT|nr:BACON domain-containing protein [Alistipes sp.]